MFDTSNATSIATTITIILGVWTLLIAFLFSYDKKVRVKVYVSHMNRISSSLLQHNQQEIAQFLKESGKANFVLPNGAIIVGVVRNGQLHFTMLENQPTDTKRFISSTEFNSLHLSAPLQKGSSTDDVHIFIRHGQALHNLTSNELQELWKSMAHECKTLKELRRDAPLTEKGQQEAREASYMLASYLEEHYPESHVTFYTSELLRAYETASLIVREWNLGYYTFTFDNVIYAGFRELNELHREIGSTVHMLGTPGRLIAETNGLTWQDYAPHILKNPPLTHLNNPSLTIQEGELKERVEHVTIENIPMEMEKRPTTLHGMLVKHVEHPEKQYKDGIDLFYVLQSIM